MSKRLNRPNFPQIHDDSLTTMMEMMTMPELTQMTQMTMNCEK
jgi:hypothetical protein